MGICNDALEDVHLLYVQGRLCNSDSIPGTKLEQFKIYDHQSRAQ